MNESKVIDLMNFFQDAEKLKSTHRASHTSTGRIESVAEHTWRLCLIALVLEDEFPEVDINHVIRICIVHDLGEAIIGDIPAPDQENLVDKFAVEKEGLLKITSVLPDKMQDYIFSLWLEYENATSPESRIAKALDKIETLIQLNQGINPDNFDYVFNLKYGHEYTSYNSITSAFRKIIDSETIKKIEDSL